MATRLGIRARFTGSLSQAQVRDLLGEADVLVAPGLAEGLPASIIEAFAARIPVLASRLAGIAELVLDGVSGRLVAPGNEGALAAGLVELHALGPAGRQRVGRGWSGRGGARFRHSRRGGSPRCTLHRLTPTDGLAPLSSPDPMVLRNPLGAGWPGRRVALPLRAPCQARSCLGVDADGEVARDARPIAGIAREFSEAPHRAADGGIPGEVGPVELSRTSISASPDREQPADRRRRVHGELHARNCRVVPHGRTAGARTGRPQ